MRTMTTRFFLSLVILLSIVCLAWAQHDGNTPRAQPFDRKVNQPPTATSNRKPSPSIKLTPARQAFVKDKSFVTYGRKQVVEGKVSQGAGARKATSEP
jgi:hypothetical protein